MEKRPRPDLDQVREAMREHDEAEEDEAAPAEEPTEDDGEETPEK
jgi:hypothetical protein